MTKYNELAIKGDMKTKRIIFQQYLQCYLIKLVQYEKQWYDF